MLTKFDKTPFRQAHLKIVNTLNSCDDETQFVTTTHMVDNFINWVNFCAEKWGHWTWLHHKQWDSWYNEMDLLIGDLKMRVQQMNDFVCTRHAEEEENAREAKKYPPKFVVRGFDSN